MLNSDIVSRTVWLELFILQLTPQAPRKALRHIAALIAAYARVQVSEIFVHLFRYKFAGFVLSVLFAHFAVDTHVLPRQSQRTRTIK
jgi:hypothetical protein